MGSGGKAKKAEAGYKAASDAAIADVKRISPFQEQLNQKAQRFFDWEKGSGEYAGQPKDITNAPGISDYLNIYDSANRLAHEQRYGSGAMRLTDTNSNYLAQLDQQKDYNLYNEKAGGVSNALQVGLKGENYGIANQSIDEQSNRFGQVAGLQTGQEYQYYNRPRKPSFLDSFKTSFGSTLGHTLGNVGSGRLANI